MEYTPIQETSQASIKDQVAMCVVNLRSIRQRLSTMDDDEKIYVSDISKQFLMHLVRLAHCRDAYKLKDATYSMLNLLLKNIFNSEVRSTHLRSFKTAAAVAAAAANSSSSTSSSNSSGIIANTMINTVLGSLDPMLIISNILSASSENPNNNDPTANTVEGILSILRGFNPIKIDDFALLSICNDGGCDACNGLKQAIASKDHHRSLAMFFRCIDHGRFDFGGDEKTGMASPAVIAYMKDPRVILVPLREILLGCVDPQRTLSSMGDNTTYGDEDNSWMQALYEAISNISLEDCALISHFYAYMILSRHRRQTGDCIKQFLYTIFARFIYSATEVLFCATENATAEVDGGKFIRYVEAMTNASVMGSTLNTLKAFLSWRNAQNSVAPILDILSTDWRTNYGTKEKLEALGVAMGSYISSLANPSRMVKQQTGGKTSGLDSARSVRQMEKYIPYGMVDRYGDGIRLSRAGMSAAAVTKSNGRNFNCNSFHILPNLKGCAALGPDNINDHQSVFEKVINPDDSGRGTGKILGHLTCLIDKKGLTNKAPIPGEDFDKRVNEFIKDIVFSSNISNHALVNDSGSLLPSKDHHPVFPHNSAVACFDTKVHMLLLMWQRPNIANPNLSSLTASQLELMLSKDPMKWARFITQCYFNIERVSFQLADAIMKNISNPQRGGGEYLGQAGGGMGLFDLFIPSHLKNAESAEKLVGDSIRSVHKDWINSVQDTNSSSKSRHQQQQQPGVKAQFTKGLFNVLHSLVIDEDMSPSSLVAASDSLKCYIDNLDELLMKLHA